MITKRGITNLKQRFKYNEEIANVIEIIVAEFKKAFIASDLKEGAVSDKILKANLRNLISSKFVSKGCKIIFDNVYATLKNESLYWKSKKL